MSLIGTRTLASVADVEPYLDRFRAVFPSWRSEPGAPHCWANVFPVIEQLLEGPIFEDAHCPAAKAVETVLLDAFASSAMLDQQR